MNENDFENIPKISIITVTYNAVKTIEETILSVINQTYENIEYIIIDGGSTDGTIDIIKKYEDQISYWVSEKDKGIYDAMNKGIDIATGDYVYFLGADDILINCEIIKVLCNKVKCEKPDIVSCGVMGVMEKNSLQKFYFNKGRNIIDGLPHQGFFIKTKYMKNLKFNLKYKILADYDFVLNCFTRGLKFQFFDIPICFYSLNGFSSKDKYNFEFERKEILSKYGMIEKNKRLDFLIEIIKKIFIILKLDYFCMNILGWKKHKCDWTLCRWCGRK